MRALSSPSLFLRAGVFVTGLALGSCWPYVVPLTVWPSAPLDEACMLAAASSARPLASGVLDLGLTTTYQLRPRFENHGLSDVRITGAELELHAGTADGPLLELTQSSAGPARTPLQVLVPASTSSGPGVSTVVLTAVSPMAGQELKSRVCRAQPQVEGCNRPDVRSVDERVVAVLRFNGTYPSGRDWNGEPISFPIDVCCGCLVAFPPEADARDIAGPDCNSGAAATDGPCLPGNDELVDCRQCSGSNPLCQPVSCAAP